MNSASCVLATAHSAWWPVVPVRFAARATKPSTVQKRLAVMITPLSASVTVTLRAQQFTAPASWIGL